MFFFWLMCGMNGEVSIVAENALGKGDFCFAFCILVSRTINNVFHVSRLWIWSWDTLGWERLFLVLLHWYILCPLLYLDVFVHIYGHDPGVSNCSKAKVSGRLSSCET